MIDVFNIPSQQQQTFTFYSLGAGVWQTWNKPRNAKFIEIFCLGGGAGGGVATISAFSKNGGAGGGSGGIVRGIIPAFLLPDILYILVGKGGIGSSTSNTAGGTGGISYIGLQPSTSEQTLICKSSTAVAGSGQVTGGVGATISVVALSAFGNLGLFTAIAGVAGGTGGANTGGVGTSQAALGTNLTTGGAGGGGATNTAGVWASGGSITAASAILTTPVSGGQTVGADGDSGYGTLQPFCGTGGSGGAGRDGSTGAGGNGGNGYYGCGGAGAGGSSTVVPRAGNGGDGIVIITVIS
jgi:hypothetical protein